MTKETIIDGVDVSGCKYRYKLLRNNEDGCYAEGERAVKITLCKNCTNCYFKQLKRQQYYLEKIRAYELNSLDVDWDEYEQHACDTEYSPIVDFVELALGEKEDE